MGMRNVNPIVAVLAVIGGLVVLGWILRLTFSLIPLLILVAVAVGLYVVLQGKSGSNR
jgi:hypothetical protein